MTSGCSGTGPLSGVRVLDLTRNISGPFCTMMLGDMGAEVIKVESPNGGDELRSLFRFPGRSAEDEDYFYMFNRNKRSIVVDLKQDAGRSIFKKLLFVSDVFVENLGPGVVDRLGFSWSDVKGVNPGIVYAAISGYGKPLDGSGRRDKAYDGVVQAASGVMAANKGDDGRPRRISMPLGDMITGMYAAFGVVASLRGSQEDGVGEYLDVAMHDSLISLQGPAAIETLLSGRTPSLGNEVSHRVPQNVYETADGRYVFLTTNQRSWYGLCRALDLDDLACDRRFESNQGRVAHRQELDSAVRNRISLLSAQDVEKRLSAEGVPAAVVRELSEALESPDVSVREMLQWVEHPTSGRIPLLGFPYKLSHRPCKVRVTPPKLGADTEDLLVRLLGYNEKDVEGFRRSGLIDGAGISDTQRS